MRCPFTYAYIHVLARTYVCTHTPHNTHPYALPHAQPGTQHTYHANTHPYALPHAQPGA